MEKIPFLVDVKLPSELTRDFMDKIPAQRQLVNQLMYEGTITSYALSDDRERLWIFMAVKSETEILDILAKFPLIDYMKPMIRPLMFNHSLSMLFPAMSLN